MKLNVLLGNLLFWMIVASLVYAGGAPQWAVNVAWFGGIVSVCIWLYAIIWHVTYTEDDLLCLLNTVDWKRVLQLKDELKEAKGVHPLDIFRGPVPVWISQVLDQWKKEGLVETAKFDFTTSTGTVRPLVDHFRLSTSGGNRKAEAIEKKSSADATAPGRLVHTKT